MAVYYNENDSYMAEWLRRLMAAGLIPDGYVDERDIAEVDPGDLVGFRQCHFFAGIGGWAYALRLAGWGDRAAWTASTPCQKHSSAARGRNIAPDLWPPFVRLVAAIRPRILFGEQVAQAGDWLDGVCDDLEALDYQVGAAILPACSVGQDHERRRIYFVGYSDRDSESELSVHAEVDRVSRGGSHARSLVSENGLSLGVARVRGGFGNAIVPTLAAEFIRAADEAMSMKPVEA